MKRFLLQILHFSRAERAGTIALLIVCGLVYIAPEILHWARPQTITDFATFQADVQNFRSRIKSNNNDTNNTENNSLFTFDPNTATQEDFVRLGLSEKVAGVICNYRNKGGHFREPDDLQKIYSLSPADFERLRPWIRMGETEDSRSKENKQPSISAETFAFDPNLASEEDLKRLGLSDHTVKGILNYRSKGGKFRKAEDFGKIYTLSEEDFERLAPFINIGKTETALAAQPVAYVGGSKYPDRKDMSRPVDINRAGPEDWQRLPGIGEKRALQIVKFRESLGGFGSVEQVAEMYGLPDSVFQKIRSALVITPGGIHQININTASAEELDRHPYISFKQASLIVNYRSQHGPFAATDDVAKIIAFSDKNWLAKIKPYFTVQ